MKSQLPAYSKVKRKSHLLIYWVMLVCLLAGSPLFAASAQAPLDPTEPPVAPPPLEEIQLQPRKLPAILNFESQIFLPLILRINASAVNPQNRLESLNFFKEQYLMTSAPSPDWTGSQGTCDPGTTSPAFRAAILARINYFRAMAGVPSEVVFSDASNLKAQAAALIMSANQSLSHGPTSTWACYSDLGRNGASSANLYLGRYGWEAIDGYMKDPGEGNYPAGHRRWILYPQTKEMGTGDIPTGNGYPSAQALVVFDTHLWDSRPTTRRRGGRNDR